ncbi:hypothetical protein AHF37_03130 [Paragonimus kellicotti]|nr:hypothetical protein AHF37_03130 [Paragonimus kellicotti]
MDSEQELIRIALRCRTITNTLEDYELLVALLTYLSPSNDLQFAKDQIFESHSARSNDIDAVCLVSSKCNNVWTLREGIDWLMFYFFYRRYGWDDMPTKNDKVQVFTPSITQRTRTIARDEELKFKDRIVAVSTSLIAWQV